jgi:effector-binding domain-containing protein
MGEVEMMPDIKIKEIMEQPTLTIRETATMASIPERMGEIFSEIIAFMNKKGIAPAGAPFAFWHNMNSESISKGVFDMECGFPVGMPVEGASQIKASRLPGGKVVAALHIGPYEALAETYEVVQTWIKEKGYLVEEDMWETYLTNPCEVPDKSRWMTEIFWPIK